MYCPNCGARGLVTSQNVTAPKHLMMRAVIDDRLVTSQNVTAPKQAIQKAITANSLVTSQNVTAPKQIAVDRLGVRV